MSDLTQKELDRAQDIGGKFLAWTLETGPCPISINDPVWFRRVCGLFETIARMETLTAQARTQEAILLTSLTAAHQDLRDARTGWQQARQRIDELEDAARKTYCAYCGQGYPLDGDAPEMVAEHIRTCEKHPLHSALKRIAELEAAGNSLLKIIGDHGTRVMFAHATEIMKADKAINWIAGPGEVNE